MLIAVAIKTALPAPPQEDGTDNVDGVRDRMMEEPRIATIRVRFTISAPNPNS